MAASIEELKAWIPGRIPGKVLTGPALGLGRSLAFLVEEADTELCARMDGDDINAPERLERQVEFMLAHPQVGVLGSYARIIDRDGQETGAVDKRETDDAEVRWLTRYACRLRHPSVMFRRSVVLAAGNYRDVIFERDGTYEDWDLWLRLAKITEMRNLPEALLYYRRTQTSVTGWISDWFPVIKTVATTYAPELFPGVSNRAKALELWEASVPEQFRSGSCVVPARLWHLMALRRTAERVALECGKPRNYFTKTEAFRAQSYWLRRRIMQRLGLGPLLRLRDLMAVKAA
jgi:hypothetical protein